VTGRSGKLVRLRLRIRWILLVQPSGLSRWLLGSGGSEPFGGWDETRRGSFGVTHQLRGAGSEAALSVAKFDAVLVGA